MIYTSVSFFVDIVLLFWFHRTEQRSQFLKSDLFLVINLNNLCALLASCIPEKCICLLDIFAHRSIAKNFFKHCVLCVIVIFLLAGRCFLYSCVQSLFARILESVITSVFGFYPMYFY